MAKLANNMAIPPDMALISLARHGGEVNLLLFCVFLQLNVFLQNYIFNLLTGYQEAPAGILVEEGQAYNPYFPNGGVLSMAQQLFDDMLEYKDGKVYFERIFFDKSSHPQEIPKDFWNYYLADHFSGTPATQSQLAKDVATFLAFLADPELDDRKRWAFKVNYRFFTSFYNQISQLLLFFHNF